MKKNVMINASLESAIQGLYIPSRDNVSFASYVEWTPLYFMGSYATCLENAPFQYFRTRSVQCTNTLQH